MNNYFVFTLPYIFHQYIVLQLLSSTNGNPREILIHCMNRWYFFEYCLWTGIIESCLEVLYVWEERTFFSCCSFQSVGASLRDIVFERGRDRKDPMKSKTAVGRKIIKFSVHTNNPYFQMTIVFFWAVSLWIFIASPITLLY